MQRKAQKQDGANANGTETSTASEIRMATVHWLSVTCAPGVGIIPCEHKTKAHPIAFVLRGETCSESSTVQCTERMDPLNNRYWIPSVAHCVFLSAFLYRAFLWDFCDTERAFSVRYSKVSLQTSARYQKMEVTRPADAELEKDTLNPSCTFMSRSPTRRYYGTHAACVLLCWFAQRFVLASHPPVLGSCGRLDDVAEGWNFDGLEFLTLRMRFTALCGIVPGGSREERWREGYTRRSATIVLHGMSRQRTV